MPINNLNEADGGTLDLASTALHYATDLGWPIFPVHSTQAEGRCTCGKDCSSPGKHPRVAGGFQAATADPDRIAAWWRKWPNSNIGVATGAVSGLDVLDIDPRDGGDTTLNELIAQHEALPDAPQVTSGGGGHHIYFEHRTGMRSSAGQLPGLDVRADGGYIIAPPSLHHGGQRYAWTNTEPTGQHDLVPWPGWLSGILHKGRKEIEYPIQNDNNVFIIHEGERNTRLTSMAGSMRHSGMERDALQYALLACNAQRCKPPLPRNEVQQIAQSISNYRVGQTLSSPSITPYDPFAQTDSGNADLLVQYHGKDLRFCGGQGWFIWDGRRWCPDSTREIYRRAEQAIRDNATQALGIQDAKQIGELLKWTRHSLSKNRIRAMIDLAETKAELQAAPIDFNKNPYQINVINGTIDLRTGKLRPHRREDLNTKLVPIEYSPNAECPRWREFLSEIMNGDQATIDFLQRAVGYSLTGLTQEQVFFLVFGEGANGKSVFLNIVSSLLGDYGRNADFNTVLVQQNSGPRNDLARLVGARLVTASEPDAGCRLSESVVKQLTGGDTITVRHLYREPFEYTPRFKLWLAANHKPEIRGTDYAIWRRTRMIPFNVTIPEHRRDRKLPETLQKELQGILSWAVRGCMDYTQQGSLESPTAVRSATEAYRSEMDQVRAFMQKCCVESATSCVKAQTLYDRYCAWGREFDEEPLTQPAFGKRIKEKGVGKKRTKNGVHYLGIALRNEVNSFPLGEQ